MIEKSQAFRYNVLHLANTIEQNTREGELIWKVPLSATGLGTFGVHPFSVDRSLSVSFVVSGRGNRALSLEPTHAKGQRIKEFSFQSDFENAWKQDNLSVHHHVDEINSW